MANPGQPTIAPGATGTVVRRLQRALRRTPNLGVRIDGIFGVATEAAVTEFQKEASLAVDGVVGPHTWAALPDGGSMPTLQQGSTGLIVEHLQSLLRDGWYPGLGPSDGIFGPKTKAGVDAFQQWGGVTIDGIVGDQTWAVSLHAAHTTLESAVGLQFVVN
jgi:peptidoglycan hydrolase-like protein with peptidoglycan-binding domain